MVKGFVHLPSTSRIPLDEAYARGMGLLEWAIPESLKLDRLLGDEASLERAFNGTLIQPERLSNGCATAKKPFKVAHQTSTSG